MRFLLAAVVLPPLILLGFSLAHPPMLTMEDAGTWKVLHIALMPVFPLLALGPWLVARAVNRPLSRIVAIGAYTYAVFYTALDITAGVVGGAIKEAEAGGLGIVFPIASDFEKVGGIAFVLTCALAAGVAMHATGWLAGALPAVAVIVGAYVLWQEHIFRPGGVIASALLAAGWGAFVLLIDRRTSVPATHAAA